MGEVWIRAFGKAGELIGQELRERLLDRSIAVVSFDSAADLAMGILVFDHVDQQLLDTISESSLVGRRPLLALAAGDCTLETAMAWDVLRAGATDVWTWRTCTDAVVEQLIARFERLLAIERILNSGLIRKNLIGRSIVWMRFLRQVIEVAQFTTSSILLVGESGTGKELVARLIHTLDSRKDKRDLVTLDCTTVIADLAGSEFFGHERGAFTGALGQREGAFALADHGTLFLDEIGELPLPLQAQLLRVIQERQYKRVGGNRWHPTEFRLVCATNRDLQTEVTAGQFRQDLYFRLAACEFRLPPLRDRPEDIMTLAEHFVVEQSEDAVPQFDPPVKDFLLRREYPGNVRELRQLVIRIMTRHVGSGPITVGNVPESERPTDPERPCLWWDDFLEAAIRRALSHGARLKEIGHAATETAIRIIVDEEQGNLQRAAQRLGVTDRTLQMRRANGSARARTNGAR